ncbi:DUF930 domain-containing protein [Rhizobium calliandrae]|uniref:DUF930 domain-containing protein n=1 Tax=Rhizobium calliandrae TaxID=1312182 RepID=A0ABT7K963_9HYPH|nr:DUF930 domain-containing protein [Rhizobium calliandrae]MDL2405162.1 DUF930 domain-containing protein [Rhizobium calliandrae]
MERVAEQREPEKRGWGLIPSILLHILFFAALFFLPVVAVPLPQPEESINVEMVQQPQEQAKNAVKPVERSGRVPTPTPKPDQKQPETEQKAASTDKTEGEQTAEKLSDESKTKTEKAPDPNAQDQNGKSQEPAQADKPADVKADQPTPPTEQAEEKPQPGDALSPKAADDQAKPQAPTPADAQQQNQAPPATNPDTETQQTAADQPRPDAQMDQASTKPPADDPTQPTPAEQAAPEAAAPQQKDATPPAADADMQLQQQAEAAQPAQAAQAAQANAQAKAAETAAASATDPNARDLASTPTLEELATDQPSDTQIAEPDKPSADAAGAQADQKPGTASDLAKGHAKAAQGQVDPNARQQAAADQKLAPDVVVPTTGGAAPRQQSQDQSTSGGPSDPTAGTAFVPEPQSRPQQQASADGPQEASNTDPSQTEQKPGGQQGKFIEAKRFYSGTELARLSKDELDAWKKLPRRTRVQRLCNSEEKLQFGYDLKARGFYNSLVTPAMLSDVDLVGDGAGVLTPKGWLRVAFKCNVDEAALKVVAFSYLVRGHVSANQLERIGPAGN